jgi:arylsulfatase A-like enzyme
VRNPILSRRDALSIAGASLLESPACARLALRRDLPNIVYILADDLGYGDVSCQNPHGRIETPHLDNLATQGIRFPDAHDPTAVCTPSRYGILTGRFCWRTSLKSGVLLGYSPPLIAPGRLTVPAMLKRHGYRTAAFGKWHLGMQWQTKDGRPAGMLEEFKVDFGRPITDGPIQHGFDSFFGLAASADMPPYVFIENDRVVANPTAMQQNEAYVRQGRKDPDFAFDLTLPRLTGRVTKFIADHRGPDPFFIYFALPSPHTPIAPSAEFRGRSRVGDYGDYVMETDWAVGQVLEALKRRGIERNTLVLFTSDNGPETPAYPRILKYGHYSMGELRGVKRDVWEGGHRVPFLARWPGRIRPGSISDEVVCHSDLMATLAALVGEQLPDDAAEDSVNILPALFGHRYRGALREATVHHSAAGRFAIRKGSWVFIDGRTGDDNREPEWFKRARGYTADTQPGVLYDLSRDLSEKNNLYADHPDIVCDLKALLDRYKSEGRSVPHRGGSAST